MNYGYLIYLTSSAVIFPNFIEATHPSFSHLSIKLLSLPKTIPFKLSTFSHKMVVVYFKISKATIKLCPVKDMVCPIQSMAKDPSWRYLEYAVGKINVAYPLGTVTEVDFHLP